MRLLPAPVHIRLIRHSRPELSLIRLSRQKLTLIRHSRPKLPRIRLSRHKESLIRLFRPKPFWSDHLQTMLQTKIQTIAQTLIRLWSDSSALEIVDQRKILLMDKSYDYLANYYVFCIHRYFKRWIIFSENFFDSWCDSLLKQSF